MTIIYEKIECIVVYLYYALFQTFKQGFVKLTLKFVYKLYSSSSLYNTSSVSSFVKCIDNPDVLVL